MQTQDNFKKTEIVPAVLFFFLTFSIIMQDLILQNYFGTIARSPIVFISPALFVFLLVYQKKVFFSRLVKYYFNYAAITIISSLLIMLVTIFFVTNGNMNVYSEFFPVKLLKTSYYNLTYFFTIYNLFILCQCMSVNTICRVLEVFVYFMVVYGLLQLFFGLRIPFINTTTSDVTRISLTASEPSNAAPMFLTIAATALGLRFYLKRNILISYIHIILIFVMLVLIGSKGILLLLPLAIIIAVRKALTFKVVFVALLVMIPLIFVIIHNVIPLMVKDISDFNSFSTRITCLVAACKSLFLYPLGEGYGTYLVYYPPMLLPTNNEIVHIIGLPLLNIELTDMVQTGKKPSR